MMKGEDGRNTEILVEEKETSKAEDHWETENVGADENVKEKEAEMHSHEAMQQTLPLIPTGLRMLSFDF